MKIKLIFTDNINTHDEDFILADNPVSNIWIKKIKHLCNIKIDPIETSGIKFKKIEDQHKKFCKLAEIEFKKLNYNTQEDFNYLHELYEKHHDKLSKKKENEDLYMFHHAVHNAVHEKGLQKSNKNFFIGWGIKEGPLTTNFKCNQFYSSKIKKNNLYLPWTELGKKPLTYFKTHEPDNIERFIQLAKPHITLRPKFMIARYEEVENHLPEDFNIWFNKFKNKWLSYHELNDWKEQDEFSAVLLASPINNIDIDRIISNYPTFHSISII
jgi:hypothetical protein